MRWNRQIHRDGKWNRGYVGLGGRKMESYCLKDTAFQFGKMKKFLYPLVQQLQQHNVNLLNTTELDIFKWLKW